MSVSNSDFISGSSLLTSGVGAVGSAIGSYYSSQGQQTQLAGNQLSLNSNAHMAALNASLSEMQAQAALRQGQRQTQQVQLAAGQTLGAQLAGFSANGIDLTSATPVSVMASTQLMSQADANTIQQNAIRTAWGYRMQGTNEQNQALMDAAGASASGTMANSISPGMSTASSLLSGASQVASGWYRYVNAGVGAGTPSSETATGLSMGIF